MRQRILTAIIAFLIFIPFILYGKLPFVLFTIMLATIGFIELLKMSQTDQYKITNILSLIYIWITLFQAYVKAFIPTIYLTIVLVMVLLTYTVFSKNRFTFHHAGTTLLATLYISMGFYFLITLRLTGLQELMFVLVAIWATDIGAYFMGRSFGKRKLWPHISPNKTIEGAIGGLVSAVICAMIFQMLVPLSIPFIMTMLMAAMIAVVGQIGDLVASAYKRYFAVKDSGKILPGHGGILDRLDSLLFVLPMLYLIQFFS